MAAEQRYYSLDRTNLPTKDSGDYWLRSDPGALPDPEFLRREKIYAIERGDDFTANEQLLQVVAITKFLVVEDAEPEIRRRDLLLVRFNEALRNEHADFLSTARATPARPGTANRPAAGRDRIRAEPRLRRGHEL